MYIITGGLGGFGQALAVHLAQHGATRLVLTSRSGVRHGAQRRLLSQLEAMGVLVRDPPCASCPANTPGPLPALHVSSMSLAGLRAHAMCTVSMVTWAA